ncbi:response regulator, partial [Myxococcota bacterium]|nr:response regulator [Myxococcota bacterium]
PSMQKMALTVLKRNNYHVLVASTGREALELAHKSTTRIDLLITDIVIPDMNGRRVASALKAKMPDLRILFMSGYTAQIIESENLLGEGSEFLQKPFSVKGFTDKVRELLESPPPPALP